MAGFLLEPLLLSPGSSLAFAAGRRPWVLERALTRARHSPFSLPIAGVLGLSAWPLSSKTTPSSPKRRNFTPCFPNMQTEARSVWMGQKGLNPTQGVAGCASASLSPVGFWAPSLSRGCWAAEKSPCFLEQPAHKEGIHTAKQDERRTDPSPPTVQPGLGVRGAFFCPKAPRSFTNRRNREVVQVAVRLG